VLAFLEKEPDKRPTSVGAGLDALAAAAAGAGFDVKVVARRSGGAADSVPTTVRVGGGATPVEAEARTILGNSDACKTVIGVEAAPKPASGRPMIYGALGAALLIAAIGVGVVTQRAPSVAPVSSTTRPEATALPAAKTESAEPVTMGETPKPPAVAPSVTAVTAEVPAEVELTIDATPKVVDVYQGTTKVGSSSAPVKLKRAEGKVKLTFKAAGYAPQELEVTASSNAVVDVTLKKVAGTRRGDLEF
jgi:hypothetical protein